MKHYKKIKSKNMNYDEKGYKEVQVINTKYNKIKLKIS